MKASAQELFLQANQSYAKKDYQHAADLYNKIPNKSAAIWYNLGNCAYKSGNDMQALLYWKRAQKMGNRSIKNYSLFNCAVIEKKLAIPESSNLIHKVPILPLQVLFFCTFSVFLVINRKLWNAKRFGLLLTIALFVIGSGALTFASYKSHTCQHALIMNDASTIYTGPDNQYHEIAQIPQASSVAIREKKDGWSKISWCGHTGWIENKNLELI
jgi:tetratricopeptide (TPR) repeat protein